jgi:signal transduction histidine kinase
VDGTLEGVARAMSRAAERQAGPLLPPETEALLRRFFGPEFADRFFQFLDPRGRTDPSRPRLRGDLLHVSPKALQNATEGIATFETIPGPGLYPVRLLTFPVRAGGQLVNVLQVGMSLEGLVRARRSFLWAMAALLPLGLLLAGSGGWLLARRALRPVDIMTQAARRIEAESLAERLQGAEADDELGRLARTLNDMLSRLEAAFAQVRRFSADASHELRTPLTILRGEIEVALRTPRDAEEYRRVLRSALAEVERLSQLAEDLLLLSRADAGALQPAQEAVELDRLAEEAARQGEALGGKHGVRVVLEALEPLVARGDERLLRQLLLNLVDNAVKYTPAGGRVTLALRAVSCQPSAISSNPRTPEPPNPESAWAEIAVRDEGPGIPAESLPRIFDRFYRGDAARGRAEGSGLGLCIARTIATLHGGRIEVESGLGAGSTFRVLLPTGR